MEQKLVRLKRKCGMLVSLAVAAFVLQVILLYLHFRFFLHDWTPLSQHDACPSSSSTNHLRNLDVLQWFVAAFICLSAIACILIGIHSMTVLWKLQRYSRVMEAYSYRHFFINWLLALLFSIVALIHFIKLYTSLRSLRNTNKQLQCLSTSNMNPILRQTLSFLIIEAICFLIILIMVCFRFQDYQKLDQKEEKVKVIEEQLSEEKIMKEENNKMEVEMVMEVDHRYVHAGMMTDQVIEHKQEKIVEIVKEVVRDRPKKVCKEMGVNANVEKKTMAIGVDLRPETANARIGESQILNLSSQEEQQFHTISQDEVKFQYAQAPKEFSSPPVGELPEIKFLETPKNNQRIPAFNKEIHDDEGYYYYKYPRSNKLIPNPYTMKVQPHQPSYIHESHRREISVLEQFVVQSKEADSESKRSRVSTSKGRRMLELQSLK